MTCKYVRLSMGRGCGTVVWVDVDLRQWCESYLTLLGIWQLNKLALINSLSLGCLHVHNRHPLSIFVTRYHLSYRLSTLASLARGLVQRAVEDASLGLEGRLLRTAVDPTVQVGTRLGERLSRSEQVKSVRLCIS
jgi:hypothetical protein